MGRGESCWRPQPLPLRDAVPPGRGAGVDDLDGGAPVFKNEGEGESRDGLKGQAETLAERKGCKRNDGMEVNHSTAEYRPGRLVLSTVVGRGNHRSIFCSWFVSIRLD